MATFQDNINTIQTAVYGKEMRPAISEALTQSWDAVLSMTKSVDRLNARVDAISGISPPDSGVGDDGENDELDPPILVVYGPVTSLEVSGVPTV